MIELEANHMILKILAACVNAAIGAGNIVRNVLKIGNLNIVEKGFQDYQTEADRLSQRLIFNYLKYHFPRINIVGEEEIQNKPLDDQKDLNVFESPDAKYILELNCPDNIKNIKEEDVVIWVDPLDGTSEFTEGISYKGKAIGGVICQPFFEKSFQNLIGDIASVKDKAWQTVDGRIIWGLQGIGIHGAELKKPPPNQLIICTTNSHRSQIVQEAIDALKPDQILHVGGCGMKVLLVIEGIAHAYVYASKGSKKWDTCAPEAILRAAGGSLTDITGNLIDYSLGSCKSSSSTTPHSWWVHNYLGILATNPSIDFKNIVSKIPRHIIDKLNQERETLIKESESLTTN